MIVELGIESILETVSPKRFKGIVLASSSFQSD